MDQEISRQLPYDVDIEQALLGAILIDNYSLERVSTLLKPEHFYDPLHQRLYDSIERMWSKGHAVTPLTLKAMMEQDAGLEEVGGQAYLSSLARGAPAFPNVKDYARILADLAIRRELIRIGEDIVNTAFEAPIDFAPKAQIEEAEKALYRVAERSRFGEGPVGFEVALAQAVQQAELALARGGPIAGVPSGFTDLDSLLGGLHASDLLIVAGRPGMGKTALATNIDRKSVV